MSVHDIFGEVFDRMFEDNSGSELEGGDVSEEEDGVEHNPDSNESSLKKNPDEERDTFLSKNGSVTWSSTSYDHHGKHSDHYVIKMTPGQQDMPFLVPTT
ncbi:PiggyBac transposable elementderived protein 4like, partial [Caligus rogercresseyi]